MLYEAAGSILCSVPLYCFYYFSLYNFIILLILNIQISNYNQRYIIIIQNTYSI